MKGGSIGRENGKKVLMGLEKTQQGIICPPLQPSICGSFVLRPETSIGSTKKQKSSDSLRRIDSTLFGRASQVLAAHLISRQIGPCALIHNRSVRLPGVVLHRPSITNVLESIWLACLQGGLEVIRSASQLEQHPQFVLSERLLVCLRNYTKRDTIYCVQCV